MIRMTIAAAALAALLAPAYANNDGHNSIAGCYFEVGKECQATNCSDADREWGYDQCDIAYAADTGNGEESRPGFGFAAPTVQPVFPMGNGALGVCRGQQPSPRR
jgi:hypothetical protein